MLIDTHKAIERMTANGFNQKQAETITDVISNMDQQVATKSDIDILKAELNAIKWMVGVGMAIMIMMLSSMKF